MKPVAGFRFAAARAGIKKNGALDVGLAVADAPVPTAALFTRNIVRAAPVVLAAERVRSGLAQAVVANSGCANACTGEPGTAAAISATEVIARALSIESRLVLPASTGVIGALLPAEKIAQQAQALAAGATAERFTDFAEAIRTTDRFPKLAEATLADGRATVLGIAKGAGMIHPDVGRLATERGPSAPHATMLAFLFTDAVVEASELERALIEAADSTFNACSVDGDTSTNDTVIAMASGASGARGSHLELTRALTHVCRELARSMVLDGEGSRHLVEVVAVGLANDADARRVVRTVATSLLVKTALHGRDANWGRLLAAAGRAGIAFDPDRAAISIGDVRIVENGQALGTEAEQRAQAVMQREAYGIELRLGDGPGRSSYLMCDLGHDYVDVNATYRS
jgi:glutamate N-acetyltransferase/amino-acid N-acetyltransferase